ncbi:hypothetical protein L6164_036873 [Bauhinia variegata]|uniref:Uncharacterized protein n=1 Tax=Bauhinia variegata TaxID=167791 RepID=A0ACB9KIC8_BAUVA|nr:hypothetical protein L6164_036873 [Bauhinia variegata]
MEMGMCAHMDLKREGMPDLTGHVHQLPCCIKYEGPSTVSCYFKPKSTGSEVEGVPVEEAYFRGRKLQGTTIPLPEGYSGFILSENPEKRKATVVSAKESKYFENKAVFQSITYWNHDSAPSKDDDFSRVFHSLDIAKALHKPVTPEDLASSSIAF